VTDVPTLLHHNAKDVRPGLPDSANIQAMTRFQGEQGLPGQVRLGLGCAGLGLGAQGQVRGLRLRGSCLSVYMVLNTNSIGE
jgi:hypothetical protein